MMPGMNPMMGGMGMPRYYTETDNEMEADAEAEGEASAESENAADATDV